MASSAEKRVTQIFAGDGRCVRTGGTCDGGAGQRHLRKAIPARARRRRPWNGSGGSSHRRSSVGIGRRLLGITWAMAVAVVLAVGWLPASQAEAQTTAAPWFRRFPLPAGSRPWSLAVTPDGTLWVTLMGRRQLGALNPETGRWRFVPLPATIRQPARLAAGPDGSLWLTDNDFGQNPGAALYRYHPDPAAATGGGTPAPGGPKGWRMYRLPFPGASAVAAARGSVWLVQFQGNRLGRLDPATGRVTTYTLPLPDFPWPSNWDLVLDKAGHLWTVSPRTGTVYRFDPQQEGWASFPLPPDVAGPAGLAVTPDGDGVWVTEHGGRTIGRLDVATRAWVPLLTPPAPPNEEIQATRPNDLEWDAQGRLWAALHTGNALARIDPASATLEIFPLPAAEPKSWVQWLARGPDGSLWFAAYGRDYVGRVDPEALPLAPLAATVEPVRLPPGAMATVRLALARTPSDTPSPSLGAPGPGSGGGAAPGQWQVADLPRGWQAHWEERGAMAARVRLTVPRNAEAGVYPVVLAARLPDGRLVTRTVRLDISPAAAFPWLTVALVGALLGALGVGWLGVLASLQAERRREAGRRTGP